MYLKDPKDGQPSVSLTLLAVSFVILLGFAIASVLDYAKDPAPLLDIFYACAALYFGRRVTIGGKTFEVKDKNNDENINSNS